MERAEVRADHERAGVPAAGRGARGGADRADGDGQAEFSRRFKGSPVKRAKRRGLLRNVPWRWGSPEAVPVAIGRRNRPERWYSVGPGSQIPLNLLTNAGKFTPSGVSVRLDCDAVDGAVRIRVSDSGRGIADDKLESIFEPFVQVGRHLMSESQQGVGLGLAISREMARAMGGDLSAESTLGAGSAFTLSLPCASPTETGSTASGPTVFPVVLSAARD